MPFTREELTRIVERASTITERMGDEVLPIEGAVDNELIEARLDRWCKAAAEGDQVRFERRLSWDGLDLAAARRAVGGVRLREGQPLPKWADTLDEALKYIDATVVAAQVGGPTAYRFLNSDEPLPFEAVLAPFVQFAREQLTMRVRSSDKALSAAAQAAQERYLLMRLDTRWGTTLLSEFNAFRVVKNPLWLFPALRQKSGGNNVYSDFVRSLLKGGLPRFFSAYPVLARLTATAIDQWVEATAELVVRLETDHEMIRQTFQNGGQLGDVVALEPGLSDPHNGGRVVTILTFASGLKLVYKPKDLSLEAAYQDILDWLNGYSLALPFKVMKVINRSDYGWIEYIDYAPCVDSQMAERFYQRAGMLICLLYALNGSDCHYGNLIAHGEHPILIDMEALIQPRVRSIADLEVTGAGDDLSNSVLMVGLLPQWEVDAGGKSYDVSGLGVMGETETGITAQVWLDINTDDMDQVFRNAISSSEANAPSLAGTVLNSGNYIAQILEGFREMYQVLVDHRAMLLAADGPVAALNRQSVRFIFRATKVYAITLYESYQPTVFNDGAEWSLELETLSRALLQVGEKNPFWPVFKAEVRMMTQGDVPYFAASTDNADLEVAPGEQVERAFTMPSYHSLIAKLVMLGENDFNQQLDLVKSAFYSSAALSSGGDMPVSVMTGPEPDLGSVPLLSQQQLIEAASAIAAELRQRAIHLTGAGVSWIAPKLLPDLQHFQLRPLDFSLYAGCCGPALFLAALDSITGGADYRDLILAALRPLRKFLQKPESSARLAAELGIGGASGLGSVIYSLTRIAEFMGDDSILQDSRQLAALITPTYIAGDQALDVIAGSAGAILSLLPLYRTTGDPLFLEQALACGRHLLDKRVPTASGCRAWATFKDAPLSGFSHGAAGIAYALLELYAVTRIAEFREAAREAIAYEGSIFVAEAGNWLDLRVSPLERENGAPECMVTWCHGAPGIGLARLGSLSADDTPEMWQDLEVALETTRRASLHDSDHLCCGVMGRMEILLTAGRQLERPDLISEAYRGAAVVVDRAQRNGGYTISSSLPRTMLRPGFFQGISGIGYELLRFAHPDRIPSVLLWQ